MGFFDDWETPVDEIPTGFGLPIGVYPVVLTDVKKHVKEDTNAESTLLEFKVNTLEDEKGRTGSETVWLTKPVKGATNSEIHASVGKQWMLDIGVPESVMAEKGFDLVEQKDSVIGTEGVLKVTEGKKGYTNKKFIRNQDESGVSDMAGDMPADKSEVAVDTSGW